MQRSPGTGWQPPSAASTRPPSPVRPLGAYVDDAWLALDGVEVLGEALPPPPDALGKGGAGDVLHSLHQADQPVVTVGGDGREPHAAVPHDRSRDAVPARRGEQWV